MNCPKCGLQTLPGQRFCRSCGDSLQLITQPLVEQATATDLEKRPEPRLIGEKQRAHRLTPWGFIIMFIGVAIGVIGKMLIHDEVVTVVGVLVSLVGMFLTVYPYLSPPPRRRVDSPSSTQAEALTQSQPTKYLPQESNIEYVPSVAERTTDLLTNPEASKPKQKDGGVSEA